MYCEKGNGYVKEQKPKEAIKFYKKAAKSWENLIIFDKNNNYPAYEQKRTEIEKNRGNWIKKKKIANKQGGSGEDDEDAKLKEQ